MAILLSDNLRIGAPKPVDDRYLAADLTAYANVTAANNAIVASRRHLGLKVLVGTEEYFYKSGIANTDLVPVVSGTGNALTGGTLDQFTNVAQSAGVSLDFTTALTVNTGSVTLTGNSANTSILTIGAGNVSVSGVNTGDQTNITGNAATVTTNANLSGPVTSSGNTTSIADGAISNAMLSNAAVANLTGINTGDQFTFKTITVGSTSIVADATNDTLTLAAGTNITLTANASTDTVTVSATVAPATLLQGGATAGQLLQWSGSAWAPAPGMRIVPSPTPPAAPTTIQYAWWDTESQVLSFWNIASSVWVAVTPVLNPSTTPDNAYTNSAGAFYTNTSGAYYTAA